LNRDADDLVAEPDRSAIDDATGELTAGRVDVIAARTEQRSSSSRKRWMTAAGERR